MDEGKQLWEVPAYLDRYNEDNDTDEDKGEGDSDDEEFGEIIKKMREITRDPKFSFKQLKRGMIRFFMDTQIEELARTKVKSQIKQKMLEMRDEIKGDKEAAD